MLSIFRSGTQSAGYNSLDSFSTSQSTSYDRSSSQSASYDWRGSQSASHDSLDSFYDSDREGVTDGDQSDYDYDSDSDQGSVGGKQSEI